MLARNDSLTHWLAWLGTPDCTCPSAWKGIGRLDGIDMGKGWVRLDTDPKCPHHSQRDAAFGGQHVPPTLGSPDRPYRA